MIFKDALDSVKNGEKVYKLTVDVPVTPAQCHDQRDDVEGGFYFTKGAAREAASEIIREMSLRKRDCMISIELVNLDYFNDVLECSTKDRRDKLLSGKIGW